VSQSKTPTGDVCHLTTCFLQDRSIIFLVIYPQAWCIAWMFTRLKSQYRDRDVISSRPRRWTLKTEMRSRRSIFPNSADRHETETFNLQDRDEKRRSKKRLETVSRPRRSRPRLHPCIPTYPNTFGMHGVPVLTLTPLVYVCLHRGGSTGGRCPSRDGLWSFFHKQKSADRTSIILKTNISTRGILWRLKSTEIRFRPGLRPGPRWGSSRRSPRPPSRLRRGKPPPHSPPPSTPTASRLGAFGASTVSTPLFYGWRRPCVCLFNMFIINYEMTMVIWPKTYRIVLSSILS